MAVLLCVQGYMCGVDVYRVVCFIYRETCPSRITLMKRIIYTLVAKPAQDDGRRGMLPSHKVSGRTSRDALRPGDTVSILPTLAPCETTSRPFSSK